MGRFRFQAGRQLANRLVCLARSQQQTRSSSGKTSPHSAAYSTGGAARADMGSRQARKNPPT